jgi:hypothetical protein
MAKWKEHPAPLDPVPPVAGDDLVARLREPDYHDPACPYKTYCYCGDDENPSPHDKVRHPNALEAADRIEALEAQVARLTPSPSSQPPAGRPIPPTGREE